MGNVYKPWYPILRNKPPYIGKLPRRTPTTIAYDAANNPEQDPALLYPVRWIPVDQEPESHFGQNPDGPDDSVFAKVGTVTRLPKVVVVLNGIQNDLAIGFGEKDCPADGNYPVLPNTALRHYAGLANAIAAALPPGITVYSSFESAIEWIYRVLSPMAPGQPDFVGGDLYYITIQNDSYYKATQRNFDVFPTTYSDFPCGASYGGSFVEVVPRFNDITQPAAGYSLSPLDTFTATGGQYRNFHGLACAVPWDGDSVNYVLTSSPGLPFASARNRMDLNNADLFTSMQSDVELLNAASPVCVGDATWEYAQVTSTEDVSFFVSKILTWFSL